MTEAQFDFQSLDPEGLTSVLILVEIVDKKVLTLLRDGSIYIGFLRTFDQYGTIVLHKTIERIYIKGEYGEIPLGVFLIRSENIVLIGEIDSENEYPQKLTLIPKAEILRKRAELREGADNFISDD